MTAPHARASAPTVEAAVARALAQLGATRDQVLVDVLRLPRHGFFGGRRPAEVVVTLKPAVPQAEPGAGGDTTPDEPPQSADPLPAPHAVAAADTPGTWTASGAVGEVSADRLQGTVGGEDKTTRHGDDGPAQPQEHVRTRPEEDVMGDATSAASIEGEESLSAEERMNQLDEEADLAADFVEGLLDCMDLPGDIEIEINEDQALLNLEDVGSGLLIGRRGATLDALQELIRCAVQRQTERRSHVRVDVEGYRGRYLDKLRDRAREAIAEVRETGEPVQLEPMDAYERKLMHDLVAKTGGVTSSSEGMEPKRRVVIHPDR